MLLKFSPANSKLSKLERKTKLKVYSLSLPSGVTCPFASKCRSKAVQLPNGKYKVVDGKDTEFRCYSASQEALYPTLYKLTRHNFNVMENARKQDGVMGVVNLILLSLPKNAGIIRISESGDIYNNDIMLAWILVAKQRPAIKFYAYTKSTPYYVQNLDKIPNNLKITASYGGSRDDLIELHDLPNVMVVKSTYEARQLKRPVDIDDSHTYRGVKRFALVIHGQQKQGSGYAKAWNRILKARRGKKAGVSA